MLPLLFTLIFGMTDVGMLVFNNTQVTAAARDGSRQAVLHYSQADGGSGGTFFAPPCSSLTTDQTAICTAIEKHLVTTNFQFSVQCLAQASSIGGTAPNPPQEACTNATPDQDLIRVTVKVTRTSWTAVLPSSVTITGSSSMTIIGLPS